MAQTILAYLVVAAAAAWTLRSFLPRLNMGRTKAKTAAKAACENCDCGH